MTGMVKNCVLPFHNFMKSFIGEFAFGDVTRNGKNQTFFVKGTSHPGKPFVVAIFA